MATIFIRTDANPRMGSGHLMRCLALAQAWKTMKGDAVFLTQTLTSALKSQIKSEGMTLVEFQAPAGKDQDVQKTLKVIRHSKEKNPWLVIDGYQFSDHFSEKIMSHGVRVLKIDDFRRKQSISADLILNQTMGATAQDYPAEKDKLKLLCGEFYTLFRKDFSRIKSQSSKTNRFKKVLLTLGGSDPLNLTQKLLKELVKKTDLKKEIRVIVGPSNPHFKELQQLERDRKIKLFHSITHMVPHYQWADFVVTAAGSTIWEILLLKKPFGFFTIASNQKRIQKILIQKKLGINLGSSSKKSIIKAVQFISSSRSSAPRLNVSSIPHLNPRGASAVVSKIKSDDQFRFRLVEKKDSSLILQWKNDPITRFFSKNQEKVEKIRHQKWFTNRLNLKNPNLWIVETNGVACGTLRLDQEKESTLSWTVAPDFRGKGLGKKMVKAFSDRLNFLLVAWIHKGNVASQKIARFSGFKKESSKSGFEKWKKG